MIGGEIPLFFFFSDLALLYLSGCNEFLKHERFTMLKIPACAEVEDIDPEEVKVIAAGPITKTRSSLASRVVLASHRNKEYIVWTERFPLYPSLDQSSFSGGHYFNFQNRTEVEALVAATKKFSERVAEDAENHFEAIEI